MLGCFLFAIDWCLVYYETRAPYPLRIQSAGASTFLSWVLQIVREISHKEFSVVIYLCISLRRLGTVRSLNVLVLASLCGFFATFCGQITVAMRQYENWLCRDVSGKSLVVTKFPRVSVVHNTVLHVVVVQT